uniref:Glycosyltransferase n=1 Tax=Dictyoglomus thermophilum TaxID=14 RepID=A0A7C3PSP8_DICTH
MIKLCHITTVHPSFDVRIFHKECKTLAKSGYYVYLIVQHHKEEVIDGVHILPLPKVGSRLERVIKQPWRALRLALKTNSSIYHLHDPELIPIGLILKLLGKNVIFDSHEDVPLQLLSKPYLNRFALRMLSQVFSIFEKYSCRYFDGIVCATPSITEKFLKINPNSVNVNNYPLLEESKFLYHNYNENKMNEICYIGGISQIRGITELIKALEFVDNVRLNLAGNFESAELEKRIKGMKGWKKVNYYGFVGRENVYEIMARSKAGVVIFSPLPNHINSQPNKMFEYMSAGLPVITSNFPLWREIVERDNCGICVDPLNPKEIADAIRYIIEHPEEAKKMGENGRRVVLEKYNWEKESKKLLDLYKELLKREIKVYIKNFLE